jgi:hypothetical protein
MQKAAAVGTVRKPVTATGVRIGWVVGAVALLAGTALGFQVALTRAFSLIFQYHYVFLVVSLAILGLGFGAAIGYGARQLDLVPGSARATGMLALVLAVIFPVTAFLLSSVNSSDLTPFSVIVALIPFLLLGWINAMIYSNYAAQSNLIYGADLIGAAAGILVSVALLMLFGPFTTMIASGLSVCLAAALLLHSTRDRWFKVSVGVLIAIGALVLGNHVSGFIAYDPAKITVAPPDKTMVHVLNDPNQGAEVIQTEWGAFAQVDVVQTNDPDAYFVFTDAGAGSIMIRSDPDTGFEAYDWIEREVQYLPFTTGPVANTLIIGAGAGYDVVLAKHAGAETITAVEINPAIVEVTRERGAFNGDILDTPGVTTVITDGRNFVDRTEEPFDLIYMNVVYSQAAAPTSAALAENHAFTVEALRAYWGRLTENGRVGFVSHNGLEGVRLLMTALAALQGEDIPLTEALHHTALVMSDASADPSNAPSVLLLNKQPWTAGSAASFEAEVERRELSPLYIPHVAEDTLRVLLDGTMTLKEYIAANEAYNIFPTTDNQPFFYHLNAGLPAPLNRLLQISFLLTTGYIILAAALQPAELKHEWSRVSLLVCFSLLGGGYLLAEVALQQRFRLLLGDPVLSLIVTLGSLLLGSGLGSLLANRFDSGRLARLVVLSAVGVGLGLSAAALVYPSLVNFGLPQSLPVRILLTMIAILPLGLLMGIPFPSGLRLAAQSDARGVPLYWGMNALASTVGAVVAAAIGVLAGFHLALFTGALLYLLAGGLFQLCWKRMLV